MQKEEGRMQKGEWLPFSLRSSFCILHSSFCISSPLPLPHGPGHPAIPLGSPSACQAGPGGTKRNLKLAERCWPI